MCILQTSFVVECVANIFICSMTSFSCKCLWCICNLYSSFHIFSYKIVVLMSCHSLSSTLIYNDMVFPGPAICRWVHGWWRGQGSLPGVRPFRSPLFAVTETTDSSQHGSSDKILCSPPPFGPLTQAESERISVPSPAFPGPSPAAAANRTEPLHLPMSPWPSWSKILLDLSEMCY